MCQNVHALKQLTLSKSKETAFISTGFNNWKDATRVFEQHRKSACHMEAVMKWNQHVKGTSINVQLQHHLVAQQEKARHCLMKVFTSVEYLARQGLPLRSHHEHDGNFSRLLQLKADDSEELRSGCSTKRPIHHMKYKTR